MVQRFAFVILFSFTLSGCFSLSDISALFGDDAEPAKAETAPPRAAVKSGDVAQDAQKPQNPEKAQEIAPGSSDNPSALPKYRVGDRYTFDNPVETWQIVQIAHDKVIWRSDKNESQITGLNPLLPALEWSDASGNTGRRRIRDTLGALFPMRVGAKMTFRSTVTTTAPPYGWENNWGCIVHATETVQAHDRAFETFVVGCGRKKTNELTFNYSPELGHYVRQKINQGPNRPLITRHLVAFERADGTVIAGIVPKSQLDAVKSPGAADLKKSGKTTSSPKAPETVPKLEKSVAKTASPAAATISPVSATKPSGLAEPQPKKPSVPKGTPKAVLLESVEAQTPKFGGLLPRAEAGPAQASPPSGRVGVPDQRAVIPGARPRIPVPAVPTESSASILGKAASSQEAAPAETVRVTRLRSGNGAPEQAETRAKIITATEAKSFGAHLASYRNIKNADKGWEILKNKYNDLLNDVEPVIKRVEITGKGTFYRLYAGAFENPSEAKALCDQLAKRGLFCTIS